MNDWKDKFINYLLLIVFALFGFGVVKVCEGISDNRDYITTIFKLKADKEDVKHEFAQIWKEIDRMKK